MLAALRLMPLVLLSAAGCASAPLEAGSLDAINDALANRAAIARKCGIAEPDGAAAFLSQASRRIDPESHVRLTEAAARIVASAQAEEAEYICTPEMFEQSNAAADKAQADWDKISRAGGRRE